jgi:hypothetical protein
VHLSTISPDLAKRWGKRFWQSCREKAESGVWRPPHQTPDFFCLLHGNMDKIFVDQALQAYREKTGDMRPWDSLPVGVTSQILMQAQRLKGRRHGKVSQPTAADGCVDS